MEWFTDNWPLLLAALWGLDRLADAIARMTPNTKDDELVAKFHAALQKLASLGIRPAARK